MITRHFRNTLFYIQGKKEVAAAGGVEVGVGGRSAVGRYDEVDVVGALLKMGIGR
jgi:vacuolar protein sorting-associated protein 35